MQLMKDSGEWVTITHLQFNFGRHGESSSMVDNSGNRIGSNVIAMHRSHPAVDQIIIEQTFETARHFWAPSTHMHACKKIKFARERQVGTSNFVCGIVWA